MPSRRHPSSRTSREVLGALAIWLIFTSGCGRKAAPAVSFFAAPRQGHVYVAQLVSEHPLYEQYRRLEQEIASLQVSCTVPAVPPVPLELGALFLPGPELPRFPLEQFEHRRALWQATLLPERPVTTSTELAPDLVAELQWQRHQLERQEQRQIDVLEARENECVAELRAAAVRARQEALNNAGLNIKLPEREAQEAAEKERRRLWDEIEAETAAARAQAQERIATETARIQAETEVAMTEAERSVRQRVQKRLEVFVKTGSETPRRMSNAVVPPSPPVSAPGVSWQTATPPSGEFQPTLPPLLEADRRTRLAQASRLALARAKLGADIFEATALAVERIAGLHDWRLYLPPEEPATGADMTERVRPELRRLFHPESSS